MTTKKRVIISVAAAMAVFGLLVLIHYHLAVWHWGVHVTGSDYGLPLGHFGFYDFESGSGSDLGEYVIATTVIASAAHFYWRFTCHEPKCWWPGHLMADGHTRSCWKHHPEGKPQPGHVQRKYDEHQAMQKALLKAGRGTKNDS